MNEGMSEWMNKWGFCLASESPLRRDAAGCKSDVVPSSMEVQFGGEESPRMSHSKWPEYYEGF